MVCRCNYFSIFGCGERFSSLHQKILWTSSMLFLNSHPLQQTSSLPLDQAHIFPSPFSLFSSCFSFILSSSLFLSLLSLFLFPCPLYFFYKKDTCSTSVTIARNPPKTLAATGLHFTFTTSLMAAQRNVS